MEEPVDRPKWLVELENRKRKPHLAHEAGAGSPCMVCNSACPGLDLHFWRKICKNCKCSRDDHDVNDDDFPQFDLLFGATGKVKKKSMLLQVNNKKQNEAETAFEWVPPDTTEELAADYMKALPADKLPIKGSTGAALRRQLLQKQLPLHDVDHSACDGLTENEQKQFEKYLENLKKYVGQGKVTKILAARPFNRTLMTPANATDMRQSSPQHKAQIPTSMIQLRTPSSFNPKLNVKSPYSKISYDAENNQNFQGNPEILNKTGSERYDCALNTIPNSSDIAHSEPLSHDFHRSTQPPELKMRSRCVQHSQKSFDYPTQTYDNEQQILSPANANYDKFHAVQQSEIANSTECTCLPPMQSSPLPKKNLLGHAQCSNGNINQNYPHNITDHTIPQNRNVKSYTDMLHGPRHDIVSSEEVNRQDGMLAEAILAEALLPPSAIHSGDIIGSTLDKKELSYIREKLSNKYGTQEDVIVPGAQGLSRPLINTKTKKGDVLIPDREVENTNNTMTTTTRNPGTFNTLGNITTEPIQSEIQTYKTPLSMAQLSSLNSASQMLPGNLNQKDRTATLNKISSEINPSLSNTEKENKMSPLRQGNLPGELIKTTYPEGRLCTLGDVESHVVQSESLGNQVFPHEATIIGQAAESAPNIDSLRDDMEGLTVNPAKLQKCHQCQEEIRIGDVVVTIEKAKNESWHPGCFTCTVCNELLVDLIYFYYKNKLYCGRDLAILLGIPRCFACDELIFVREYTVAEGHNYHVKHFCCWDCDIPLAGQKYVSENDRPLCLPCYQKTYAKTCSACNVVIAADQQGVAIKGLNFHANETCFCCYTCKKNLLNGRMAVKEDKLFCSKECIAKFLNH